MNRKSVLLPMALLLMGSAAHSDAASLIINEWNAVSDTNFIKSGSTDTFFGRKVANGGNWAEFVVINDHLDVRGWKLDWINDDLPAESGLLTLSNAAIWSDLRSGTIITIRQDDTGLAPQNDPANGNTPTGPYGALPSDTSYNPAGGDWWIHVNITDGTLITSTNWTVDNDNWRMRIRDASDNLVQAYTGEGIVAAGWVGAGLGSDEVAKLEQNPSATPSAYRDGASSTFGSPNIWNTGPNTFTQDFTALRAAVPEPSSLVLGAFGLVSMALYGWRRRSG